MCTVTLILAIWPWIKANTRPESWITVVWNSIGFQRCQWKFIVWTWISATSALHHLEMVISHTLGPWTTIVWSITQILLTSEKLWPRHKFKIPIHCDLEDKHLWQGHYTPLNSAKYYCIQLWIRPVLFSPKRDLERSNYIFVCIEVVIRGFDHVALYILFKHTVRRPCTTRYNNILKVE